MSPSLDYFVSKGCSYQEFIQRTPKNRERLARVYSEVSVPKDLESQINDIRTHIRLLVFAENWCSDTVLTLPILSKISEISDYVNLIVVPRDDVIEEFKKNYLTYGKAKIPVVLFLIDKTEEINRWIERTQYVNHEVKKIKSLDLKKAESYRSVIEFYMSKGTIENTTKVLACELIKADIIARSTMK
ncbi:MAG: hypothetical protein HGN29_13310 [Asgard group archaeon]|nr:hypothetical protein [Asgard group archaeon]